MIPNTYFVSGTLERDENSVEDDEGYSSTVTGEINQLNVLKLSHNNSIG